MLVTVLVLMLVGAYFSSEICAAISWLGAVAAWLFLLAAAGPVYLACHVCCRLRRL